jgi:predicted HicB family RNase H-like nuclease
MQIVVQDRVFRAQVSFDGEDGVFVGRVLDTDDVLCFEGTTVAELKAAFHALLAADPRPPAPPPVVVLPEPLLEEARTMARRVGQSLDAWLAEEIQRQVRRPRPWEDWVSQTGPVRNALLGCWTGLLAIQSWYFVDEHGGLQLSHLPVSGPLPMTLQATVLLAIWVILFLRSQCRHPRSMSRRRFWWITLAIGGVAWLAPPTNSNEVLDYLGYGRVLALHHLSPWSHGLGTLHDDFTRWSSERGGMAYGPLHVPTLALAGWASAVDLLLAVYLLKALCLGLHAAAVWTFERSGVSREKLLTYALNPLILFDVVVNGHPEGVLLLCFAATFHALRVGRLPQAFTAALGAALSYGTGVVTVAGEAVQALRRRRPFELLSCAAFLLFTALCLRWIFPHSFSDTLRLWPLTHAAFAPNHETLRGLVASTKPWPDWWSERTDATAWAFLTALGLLLGAAWSWAATTPEKFAQAQVLMLSYWLVVLAWYGQTSWWTWIMGWAVASATPALIDYAILMALMPIFGAYQMQDFATFELFLVVIWLWWMGVEQWPERLLLGVAGTVALLSTLLIPIEPAKLIGTQLVPFVWMVVRLYRSKGETRRRQTSSVTPSRILALPTNS